LEESIRVLVVDDFAPFRNLIRMILQSQPKFRIIGEASDGIEAVQKALKLSPDLVLLDVALPRLTGIDACRRIRELSPKSKILIVSLNRTWDFVEAALDAGGHGYVVKADSVHDLLPAMESVLQGKLFLSHSVPDGHL
jgi:two-component system NarL family response regulator